MAIRWSARTWRWSEVTPEGRPFDPAAAEAIACTRVIPGRDREAIAEALDEALADAFGDWIVGWRWAASEPGGGGLVRAWCCAPHSLLREGEAVETSVARVVEAIADWRAVLEELHARFVAFGDEEVSIDVAASRLLPYVLERTQAEDAWYQTFATVLGWYLDSIGLDDARIADAIDEVVQGHFASWIAPDTETTQKALAKLGALVTPLLAERDVLAVWLDRRRAPVVLPPRAFGAPLPPGTRDAHERWIDTVDAARDPDRGARMRAALRDCRASAERGEPLTFERLAAWQAGVLAVQAATFRSTEAFAKRGRERYGIAPDTEARFAEALAQSNERDEAPAIRAARIYLDVCFFHPFADGNARAARLALDHVLSRARLALHDAEPIFGFSRAADDPTGLADFATTIAYLAGPRG